MILNHSPNPEELITLLSKLKDATPEYPAELFAARKTAFLKFASTIHVQTNGSGGGVGQQGSAGGSGSALGGSTTAPGIAFQMLIGFSLVAAMLIGSYLLRDPFTGLLDENDSMVAEVSTTEPVILPLTGSSATPSTVPSPTTAVATIPTPQVTVTPTPDDRTLYEFIQDLFDDTKTNPGLHLGVPPGTPAAPGQGNPGNIHKPEKPEKPEKPDKPDKSDNSSRSDQ